MAHGRGLSLPAQGWLGEILLGGGVRDGLGELEGTSETVGFSTEGGGQGDEPGGGNILQIPTRQFFADAADIVSESFEAGLPGDFKLLGEGLNFEGAQILNAVLVFATPGEEGVFMDIQLGGNAAEGPAFGAEFDESVDYFIFFH
jgi:hypothetical protein